MQALRNLPLVSFCLTVMCACTAVPDALAPVPGEREVLRLQAQGQWLYRCALSNDGKEIRWARQAPQAELRDGEGLVVARLEPVLDIVHADGSALELTRRASIAAPMGSDLAWILYDAKPRASKGTLSRITRVQQVQTTGGAAPPDGCSSGEHLMSERSVEFRAQLRLLAP